jgi:hypothetical protein
VLWAKPKPGPEKPAALRTGLDLSDGVFESEFQLNGASRISLRFGTGEGSFRLVISRNTATLTRNPSKNEASPEDLAEARALGLEKGVWYPVRLSFQGDQVAVTVNHQTFKGAHPILREKKMAVDLLVFGETASFRNVRAAR